VSGGEAGKKAYEPLCERCKDPGDLPYVPGAYCICWIGTLRMREAEAQRAKRKAQR
jgi:hypothetical protein